MTTKKRPKQVEWKREYYRMKDAHEFVYLSLLEFVRSNFEHRYLENAIKAAQKMAYHEVKAKLACSDIHT